MLNLSRIYPFKNPGLTPRGKLVLSVLMITLLQTSCKLTQRKRIEVVSNPQQVFLNTQAGNLAAADSLEIFNEETKNKAGKVLGEILYLRFYQSKNLPADNNQAEMLAMQVCKKLWPFIPNGTQYTLWKVQFVTQKSGGPLELQKIFNFIPEELVEEKSP